MQAVSSHKVDHKAVDRARSSTEVTTILKQTKIRDEDLYQNFESNAEAFFVVVVLCALCDHLHLSQSFM